MNINTRDLSFVNFNGQEMQYIKYNNLLVWEAWKKLIASGIPPLTLTKCKGTDLIDYKLYGESVQDGTPTPETPIEVKSVGDKTKNLFNINNVIKQYGDCDVIVEDNAVTITAIGTLGAQFASNYVKNLNETKNYTLSFKAKKIVTGVDNKTILRVAVAGSNDDLSYTNLPLVGNSNPIVDTEYSFSYTVTGYKHYRFYIYNNNVSEGVIGEKTQYYDIQLQEGTTATEYESYGYRIPIKASGKNLVNIPEITIAMPNTTIPCNITETFIVSCQEYPSSIVNTNGVETSIWRLGFNYLDGTTTYIVDDGLRKVGNYINIFKASEENPVVSITYRSTYIKEGKYKDVQIEYGRTITDFEQYVEPITTNIYLDEPLRKIGDYADYIDFESGKVVRQNKQLDMSDLKWAYASELQRFYVQNTLLKSSSNRSDNLLCEIAQPDTTVNAGANNKIFTYLQNFYYYFTDYIDTPTFISAVSNRKIIFPLETPTEETIELPNIPTHKGTTILSVDSKINSSYMEVVYEGMGDLELLNVEDNLILNSILATDTETELNITNTEINEILDEIIGG